MKLYHLIDATDSDRQIGFVELHDDGELVFSDDATCDLCIQAAADAGGRVPIEQAERFLAAAKADLDRSAFVRLVEVPADPG